MLKLHSWEEYTLSRIHSTLWTQGEASQSESLVWLLMQTACRSLLKVTLWCHTSHSGNWLAIHQALMETFERKVCVLWSTSRNKLWIKGETSGESWQPKNKEILGEMKESSWKIRYRKFFASGCPWQTWEKMIMWNVACALRWKLSRCTPLHRHNFLCPGPPTLPYFDTFIFSGCFGFGGGPRQLRTKFTLILGASTPHRRMSYQRRWRCYETLMLLSKSHLDSTGKIRGTCDWSDLQVYHLGAFVMHRCTWSQTCFKPAGKEFFKIFQRKKRRFDWCVCVCVCVGIELCQKCAYISVYSESVYTYLSIFAFRSCAPWKADALPSLHVRSS